MAKKVNYDLQENAVMTETPAWLKERILKLYYEKNFFVKYLKIKVNDFFAGEVRISMVVRQELTNLVGTLHGGAVASMLDVVMSLTCASLQRRVLVLEFNTNFMRGTKEGDTVYAMAKIIHNGKRTIVVASRVVDADGRIIAQARGTFFVIGEFKELEDDESFISYFDTSDVLDTDD